MSILPMDRPPVITDVFKKKGKRKKHSKPLSYFNTDVYRVFAQHQNSGINSKLSVSAIPDNFKNRFETRYGDRTGIKKPKY